MTTPTTASLTLHPTLRTMAAIYRLPKEGGPESPRFAAYVARARTDWGLSWFNPMAGDHALASTDALLAIDAEAIAGQAMAEAARACEFAGTVELAIVLASAGMWTDRFSSEIQHRMISPRTAGKGLVYLWTREVSPADLVRSESIAESVRVMWTTMHGPAATVAAMVAREGLAYALGASALPTASVEDGAAVAEAVGLLADSSEVGDMVGVLYGDAAAETGGWTTLGLPDRAGYAWARAQAADAVGRIGAAATLRLGPAIVRTI